MGFKMCKCDFIVEVILNVQVDLVTEKDFH